MYGMKTGQPVSSQATLSSRGDRCPSPDRASTGIERRPAEGDAFQSIPPDASGPLQLSLVLRERPHREKMCPSELSHLPRRSQSSIEDADFRMSTNQVLRFVGVNRSTL